MAKAHSPKESASNSRSNDHRPSEPGSSTHLRLDRNNVRKHGDAYERLCKQDHSATHNPKIIPLATDLCTTTRKAANTSENRQKATKVKQTLKILGESRPAQEDVIAEHIL